MVQIAILLGPILFAGEIDRGPESPSNLRISRSPANPPRNPQETSITMQWDATTDWGDEEEADLSLRRYVYRYAVFATGGIRTLSAPVSIPSTQLAAGLGFQLDTSHLIFEVWAQNADGQVSPALEFTGVVERERYFGIEFSREFA